MKIKKMTADFGVLDNRTLELHDGLNIVEAPNESGKSTWCSFISAMLYGVSSSAREKNGVKPDKVRFAPWNGKPMSGTMDIEFQGRDLTLSRKTKGSSPMKEVSLTYTGTANELKVPPTEVGEALLGVPKDVFERTAFIKQGNVEVSSSPELEKRIAAIVQTGEEKSSYTEAEGRLRAAQRKLRYGQGGRLNEVENEINSICEGLERSTVDEKMAENLEASKQMAIMRRDTLIEKVAEARKTHRMGALENLTGLRDEVKACENEYNQKLDEFSNAKMEFNKGVFGGLKPEDSQNQAEKDAARHREYMNAAKSGTKPTKRLLFALLFVVLAVGAGLLAHFDVIDFGSSMVSNIPTVIFAVVGIIFAWDFMRIYKKQKSYLQQAAEILEGYGVASEEEMFKLLGEHQERCRSLVECHHNLADAKRLMEDKRRELAELESTTLKNLDFSEGDSEAVQLSKMLEEAETDLRNIRERAAGLGGRMSQSPKSGDLQERLKSLEEERKTLSQEYEALSLALDTLKDASAEIQGRMTPKLGKRCTELFNELTNGKYDKVVLDKELNALTVPKGDFNQRETGFLSSGALDQLYLAVRLALVELALPGEENCPIILDDALMSFDDERCETALKLLSKMAKERQIILFTCHSREKELLGKLAI